MEEKKMKKKLPLILMICIIVVLGATMAVLALAGVLPVPTSQGVVSIDKAVLLKEASNVRDEETLRQLLLLEDELEIVVTEDITMTDTFIVNGTKTLTGDAKITSDIMGLFKVNPIFEVQRFGHLIIDGLTLNGDGMADGVTVKQNGELTVLSGKMEYVRYGVRTNGKVTIEDIFVEKASQAGVFASFKSDVCINGGTFYDGYVNLLYVETGGYMEIHDGVLLKKCVNEGIENFGTLRIYGGEICDTTNHAIHNEGDLITEYKGDDPNGCIYIHDSGYRAVNINSNEETVLKDIYAKDIRANAIYVQDKATQAKVTVSDCVFENAGIKDGNTFSLSRKTELSNIVIKNSRGGIYVREGAEATVENITIENVEYDSALKVLGTMKAKNISIKNAMGEVAIDARGTFIASDITIDGVHNSNAFAVGIGGSLEKAGYAEVTNLTISNCAKNNVVIRQNASAVIKDSVLNKSKRTNVSMQIDSELVMDNVKVLGSKDGGLQSVQLLKGAKVTMKGDSYVTGATYSGVSLDENAVFNMEGGKIANINTKASGAGVRLFGKNAVFNMSGGAITNNSCTEAGIVYVGGNTTFNMTGGKISSSLTQKSGGGVYVLGTFNMSGGTIENNEAGTNGGGVVTASNEKKEFFGKFTMTGGTIQNNFANGNGGGISVYDKTVVKVSGGTIKGNEAVTGGNGIYATGDLTLSDKVYVKNNEVQVASYKNTVTITGSKLNKHSASDPLYILPHRETSYGTIVVNCDSDSAANALLPSVKSASNAFTMAQKSDKMTVNVNDAELNMTGADKVYVSTFTQFKEAVETTTSKRYVIISADIELTSVVTVPSGTTVYIKDDGTTRTLTRGAKCTGSMVRTYFGTGLCVAGTSYGKLVFDGASEDAKNNESIFRTRGTTEIRNVVMKNNYTNRAGGAIRHSNGKLSLYNCAMTGNSAKEGAGAVDMMNSGTAYMENCTFENNISNASGGAIKTSAGVGSVQIVGCDFNDNQSTTNGGAINADGCEKMQITDSFFKGNVTTGKQGGAIAITGKANVVLDGAGCFSENVAKTNTGGAIYTNNSQFTITGYDFIENQATAGGAIYINDGGSGELGLTECTFLANVAVGVKDSTADTAGSGGAIYLGKRTLNITDCTFGADGYGNTAVTSGGAIYTGSVANINLVGTGKDAVFAYNYSDANGGAVCIGSGILNVKGYTFDNNSADNGGAIRFNNNQNSAAYIEDTVFMSNKAKAGRGGAVQNNVGTATDNKFVFKNCVFGGSKEIGNTATEGAGAMANVGAVTEVANCTFSYNTSERSGGAIVNNGQMTFADTNFAYNTSKTKGGAINTDGGSVKAEDCSFVGNTSTNEQGGAISATGKANLTLTVKDGKGSFEANSAVWGGAIYTNNALIDITGYAFIDNSALKAGAIQINPDGDGEHKITDCAFYRNEATGTPTEEDNSLGRAGAIYIEKRTLTITNTTFGSEGNGNTAKSGGGAIYVSGVGTVNLVGTDAQKAMIAYNAVPGDGGAICVGSGVLNISGYTFDSNTAGANGGAINFNSNVNSAAEIVNTTFVSNKATSNSGGAVRINVGSETEKKYIFTSCTFGTSETTGNESKAAGGAVWLAAGANVEISDSAFNYNKSTASGGALYNSGALTLTKVNFTGNSGTAGGAINNTSGGSLTADACNFTSNTSSSTSEGGGAISITGKATANFTNTSGAGSFVSNVASNNGGAIYTNNAYVTVKGYTFDGNGKNAAGDRVTKNGGAVYINYTSPANDAPAIVFEESIFTGNAAKTNGGAICNIGYTTETDNNKTVVKGIGRSLTITNCIFGATDKGNYAAGRGGALYIGKSGEDTLLTTTITGSTFTANTSADSGGAIRNENSKLVITASTFESNRTNNEAGAVSNGGGILQAYNTIFRSNVANYNAGAIRTTGTTELYGCTFEGNQASVANNATNGGGAIFATCNMTIGDYVVGNKVVSTTLFKNNSTVRYGGAIRFTGNYTLTITGNTVFSGNSTTRTTNMSSSDYTVGGGAICQSADSATINITGATFENNTAGYRGGAIFMTKGTLTITSSKFNGNIATGSHSGAIHLEAGAKTTITGSEFKNNESKAGNGGAIMAYSDDFTVSGTLFEGNHTKQAGGAIMANGSDKTVITGSTFKKNYASNSGESQSGGAVTTEQSTATITDSVFEENESYSTRGGAAVYVNGGSMTINGNTSFTGNVLKASGAKGGAAIFIKNVATVKVQGNTTFADATQDIYKEQSNTTLTIDSGIDVTVKP